jgi:hypothetical protein
LALHLVLGKTPNPVTPMTSRQRSGADIARPLVLGEALRIWEM